LKPRQFTGFVRKQNAQRIPRLAQFLTVSPTPDASAAPMPPLTDAPAPVIRKVSGKADGNGFTGCTGIGFDMLRFFQRGDHGVNIEWFNM